MSSSFVAPAWCRGGHAQTLYAYAMRRPALTYDRERVTLPDGDFVDFDWLAAPEARATAPVVTLLHGLEGSSRSHYANHLMRHVSARGWRGVVAHFRSCSGEQNRKLQTYHSGAWQDVALFLEHARTAYPDAPHFAVGVSLGGNALTRCLRERSNDATRALKAAAVVSSPMELGIASENLAHGFNRIYTQNFLRTMKARAADKAREFPGQFDLAAAMRARDLTEFDDAFTAPVHGFSSAMDYYRRASARPDLVHLETPTLVINAKNDPFVPPMLLPRAHEVSARVTLDQPDSGGHVGFVSGLFPGHLNWLPSRILSFFETHP